MTSHNVLAVDVGGTKMAVGIVDRDGGLRRRAQVATDRSLDADALAGRLLDLIDEVVAGETVAAVGVGCGGPMEMSPVDTRVSPINIPAWRAFPLQRVLGDHTGLPVAVDNDAKALALGEGWVGGAAGVEDYIAMVVSTGVGGGIVLDSRLLDGAGGNAGHIGHVIVEPEGRTCGCGARGCLEAEASGIAIAAVIGRPPAEASPAVRERTGRLVGRGIASVANLLDLRLAVVSGSVALGFGDVFFDAARAEIAERACLDFSRGTEIRPGALGDAGPLIGAGAVAWRLLDD